MKSSSPNNRTKGAARVNKAAHDIMMAAFSTGALPGDNEDFDAKACAQAVEFILSTAHKRKSGAAAIALDSFSDRHDRLALRIAINNDDMPFLVDSVSAGLSAAGCLITRLIHPVLSTKRDDNGLLLGFGDDGVSRESFIYIETHRMAAAERRTLEKQLKLVLHDVRCAVKDWPKMLQSMRDDAESLPAGEGADLITWFHDGNLTILAHENLHVDGARSKRLGLSRASDMPMLSDQSRDLAFAHFAKGHNTPLILKSNRVSTVHRAVPLDLIIVPVREGKNIASLSISVGIWTSAALATAPENIPILRAHLASIMDRFGFNPTGHAGKAAVHALTNLPHDLLVALSQQDLDRLTLTAMSQSDRPRPKLIAVRSPLGRHLYIFVWLPRDEVSTGTRRAIEAMLIEAVQGQLLGWTIGMENGGVALLRYTLDLPDRSIHLSEAALDTALKHMLSGWEPAVEMALAKSSDAKRAAAMVARYGDAFPTHYRGAYTPDEAAQDMHCLLAMERDHSRVCRLRLAGNDEDLIRLKIYSAGGAMPLSDIVPVLENFGFGVIEETQTALADGSLAYIHDFMLALNGATCAKIILARASILESALSNVFDGVAESDSFNQLIVTASLAPQSTNWLRAFYRYLRQTSLAYTMPTVVAALAKNSDLTQSIAALFTARCDPNFAGNREKESARLNKLIDTGLVAVAAIDDDRIIRLFRAVALAVLRTNAFAPAASEALAFKFDCAAVPGLPNPLPWREIFVYSHRVEGIHLRAGPIARGGLRWSDRRDDFRTEILGLMKAQRVKNAVIVPTGAKGGFYPKQLPDMRIDRDAWLAEGTECYRIFIRSLLSITDNIVGDKVIHPTATVIHDGDDPYFVVAADKGTATFSDTANAIALERGFWLGDAFASGGSVGYDHKAMGITAKGAWISVQRHFSEMGIDVQKTPITVAGVGDMSGDVFGNGMLLSKAIKLVAAFDHRHIFIDPNPDAAASWKERSRLFKLPRSSWADYDARIISKGGGIFARSEKTIKLSTEIRELLGLEVKEIEPQDLMIAILKSNAQLLWFGGIGTYIKDASENNNDVGDPANDAIRINAQDLRAQVIGEGANLGITQAGRIGFALKGGRINTDFIDNSAGVDCSDNEVNIKIALNAEMLAGRLKEEKRNILLRAMTQAVGALVLEDNRLQTLALSIAQSGGVRDVPATIRLIEQFEQSGKLDRAVEGLASNDIYARRLAEGQGLKRPELAVLLSTAKLALQDAIEISGFAFDPMFEGEILAAFPDAMVSQYKNALLNHKLRGEIVATKLANRMINRLGMLRPFELAEEEGCALGEVAAAFAIAEQIFDAGALWRMIDTSKMDEATRLMLFEQSAIELRAHMADILRNALAGRSIQHAAALYAPYVKSLSDARDNLLPDEVLHHTQRFAARLLAQGAPRKIVDHLVRLAELDGVIGLAALAAERKQNVIDLTKAFTALGDALGLSWAQGVAMQLDPHDPWERLLAASISRDLQAMRLEFIRRRSAKSPLRDVMAWLAEQAERVSHFKAMIDRAKSGAMPTPAMLAQIAGQARVLLGR